jgi:hypothetical protein
MELIVASLAIVLVLLVLAVIRVGRFATWRSVAQVALATGSLKACLEFIRYCERL